MVVTASEKQSFVDLAQVVDRNTTPGRKWFGLANNKLDGTFHPINPTNEIGWWGTSIAGSTGAFTVAPYIEQTYVPVQSIQRLRVCGDALLNAYPVDFVVTLYNSVNAVLHTETVVANASVIWEKQLDATHDVTKLRVQVSKVNRAYDSTHLLEMSELWRYVSQDSLAVQEDKTESLEVETKRFDTLRVICTGAASAGVSILGQDVLTLSTLNARVGLLNSFRRIDTLLPKGEDSSFFVQYAFRSEDALRADPVEVTKSFSNIFSRADSLITETDYAMFTINSFKKLDLLSTRLEAASSPVTALLASLDNLLIGSENDRYLIVSFTKSDMLMPSTADSVLVFINSFEKEDLLTVLMHGSEYVTNIFENRDLLSVGSAVEVDDITVDFSSRDVIQVFEVVKSTTTNIHTRMCEAERQVFGKIEITYTDPFEDQEVEVTASSIANGADPTQTADNINSPAAKWFSLHDNVLDGSFKPINSTREIGWWSGLASNADGVFVAPPTLTVQVKPRVVDSLKVVGDVRMNAYPVDFTVTLYDDADTQLYVSTVDNNKQVTWTQDIPFVSDVAKLTLSVSKVNKPYYPVRVLEFLTSVVEVYEDDSGLMLLHLLEEREVDNGSLPVGNISANELDFRLDNTNQSFTYGNPESSISELLKPNRRVRAWLGAEVVLGQIEWHPLGTFWTTNWGVSSDNMYVDGTARDLMHLMDQRDYATSTLKENVSLGELAEDVLLDYGLSNSLKTEYYIDPELYDMVVPNGWLNRMSHRAALKLIAEAGLAVVYVNKLGTLSLVKSSVPELPIAVFTGDTNIFNSSNPQDWTSVLNHVEISWQPLTLQPEQQLYQSTDLGEVLAPGESIELTLEFTTQPAKVVEDAILVGSSVLVVSEQLNYAWGATVTVTNPDAEEAHLDGLTIRGQAMQSSSAVVIKEDTALIKLLGKLPFALNNTLIQSRSLATTLADTLLSMFSDPRRAFVLSTRGDISLELGDRVTVPTMQGTQDTLLIRQQLSYDGALESTIDTLKIS